MSRRHRLSDAEARKIVANWLHEHGGPVYPNARALAIGTKELRCCHARMMRAHDRAMRAFDASRGRRALHHARHMDKLVRRCQRAQAVAIRQRLI